MAALLEDDEQLAVGTAVSFSAPCTVHCTGVLGGARVILEVSLTGDSGTWSRAHTFRNLSATNVDHQGTYFLRGKVGAGDATTSVTLTTT